jgi:hypothetical protein
MATFCNIVYITRAFTTQRCAPAADFDCTHHGVDGEHNPEANPVPTLARRIAAPDRGHNRDDDGRGSAAVLTRLVTESE